MLASVSISWDQVGYNAGLLAAQVLEGTPTSELANNRPAIDEHNPADQRTPDGSHGA